MMSGIENEAPITKALKICKEVENGNFEARITHIIEKGETGELMHAINRLIDRMDANFCKPEICLEDPGTYLEYASKYNHERKSAEKGMSDIFSEASNVASGALVASTDIATKGEEMRDQIDRLRNEIDTFLTEINNVI
jgi:methyl-accepting chemotaxis protein